MNLGYFKHQSKRARLYAIIVAFVFIILFQLIFLSHDKLFSKSLLFLKNIDRLYPYKNGLTILFKTPITSNQFQTLISNIFLYATVFNQPLLIEKNSILHISEISKTEFIIFYDFPFFMDLEIQVYHLKTINNFDFLYNNTLNIYDLIKNSYKLSTLTFNFSQYSSFHSNTSHVKCFGNDSLTRWCDMYSVYYYKTRLLFYTKAFYKFPSPFLSIGCRSPPFDVIPDRLYDEPMIIRDQINCTNKYNDIVYMVGRFHNTMMMWHNLFDFIIPLYSAINQIEGMIEDSNRTILLRDSQEKIYWDFIQTLSHHPIKNIKNDPDSYFFSRLIVGLPKFEKNPDEFRGVSDMASFKYDFDSNVSIGLRETVLKGFGIEIPRINHLHPTIVYVARDGLKRDITNSQTILTIMRSTCPFCKVEKVNFQLLPVHRQIQVVSQATVLFGLHGSGLTHALWLPRSDGKYKSVLYEVLPYMYWCRDWYKVAAKVAGAQYFSVMNAKRIISDELNNNNMKYLYCSSRKSRCLNIDCNDILKDQSFPLELDTFNKTWMEILEILKSNKNNYQNNM